MDITTIIKNYMIVFCITMIYYFKFQFQFIFPILLFETCPVKKNLDCSEKYISTISFECRMFLFLANENMTGIYI